MRGARPLLVSEATDCLLIVENRCTWSAHETNAFGPSDTLMTFVLVATARTVGELLCVYTAQSPCDRALGS